MDKYKTFFSLLKRQKCTSFILMFRAIIQTKNQCSHIVFKEEMDHKITLYNRVCSISIIIKTLHIKTQYTSFITNQNFKDSKINF